ncbi:hypothetical protein [Candidatus Methanomassiliicoccus intestinalis]|uniref:hypothetical protein n=1 Tax=Candidatus Methanomassiliicoccus intestinalis TaxID=1406512 RepID=UPI0037DDA93B
MDSASMSKNTPYIWGIIGIIGALIGIVAIAVNWFTGNGTDYTGIDLIDYDGDFQIYIPVIIAVLGVLSLILFAVGMTGKGSRKNVGYISAIFGIIAIILAVVSYMWAGDEFADLSYGVGFYLAVISGVITFIFGIIQSRL